MHLLAKAEPITAICGIPSVMPRVEMSGMRISAATVWLTNVAADKLNINIISSAIHGLSSGSAESQIDTTLYNDQPDLFLIFNK